VRFAIWSRARIPQICFGLSGGLGVTNVRLAATPSDLDGVEMGDARGYHPGWVYHGLHVGPLDSVALLLQRLLMGGMLASSTLDKMASGHPLPAYAEPPWSHPAYGLGLMVPAVADADVFMGTVVGDRAAKLLSMVARWVRFTGRSPSGFRQA
jgi:hypothetical protein